MKKIALYFSVLIKIYTYYNGEIFLNYDNSAHIQSTLTILDKIKIRYTRKLPEPYLTFTIDQPHLENKTISDYISQYSSTFSVLAFFVKTISVSSKDLRLVSGTKKQ